MNWRRIAKVALWIVLAIVPGGLWALAVWAGYRAARSRTQEHAHASPAGAPAAA